MNHPAFFDEAPTITVHDGLAEFLGACSDGLITYRYVDAVKLAGLATPEDAGEFTTLWQERVKRILLDHVDDPELIVASEATV